MLPNIPSEFVIAGTWLWDAFGKEFIEGTLIAAKNSAISQWRKVEWARAAQKYRRRVFELYSTMRMLGNPEPVPVEGIFTELFLHDRPLAFRRYDIQRIQIEQNSEINSPPSGIRIDAIQAITKFNSLFILGKPGAGKTTLLKFVALLSARGGIDFVPIFISLHDWAQSGFSLMRYITKQFEICEFPNAEEFITSILLKKGRAIVLFDGLDEVNVEDNQRQEIIKQIENFYNQYSTNKFVITCRVSATDYWFEKFSYMEIADFSPNQISNYVRNWFITQPQKGDLFLEELYTEENRGYRELAQTPILLNLLCLNFEETLYFPSRQVDLYQEAIDALLKKWDSSRNIKRDEIYRGISVTRKQQLLSLIAAKFFEKKEIFFSEKDLVKIIDDYLRTLPGFQDDIDGDTVLKAIEAQHGLLVERAHRIHSFSHLTFQEYFVSRYIIENGFDKILLRLMDHISDKYWHEVFLMVSSMLPSAETFFDAVAIKMEDIRGYSFPIRLSRILRTLQPLSPQKRLIFLYVSSAYKLMVLSDLKKIKALAIEIIDYSNTDELQIMVNKALQVAEIIAKIRIEMDENLVPYDLLETLDSLGVTLSYFIDENVISAGKYTLEKTITLVDEINIRIGIHFNNIQGIAQDIFLAVREIRMSKNYSDSGNINKYEKKIKKSSFELSKEIDSAIKVISKIDEIMEVPFSTKGAKWSFSDEETHEFIEYLYIQKLTLECLRFASISDRKNIIMKLFLQ